MKTSTLAVLLGATASVSATDYFFRFVGGNCVTNAQRLRMNNSIPFLSPGVTAAPHDPADHFARIYNNETLAQSGALLYVVPTNPHPPPVPGYYALDGQEGVPDAYRLVLTYNADGAGTSFKYQDWVLRHTADGRTLLRYGGDDPDGLWRWIAKREVSTTGVERWIPFWVRPTAENYVNLTSWEYDVADLELEVTTAPVNSNAPGGVQE